MATPLTRKCGYYGCTKQALHNQPLCEEHDTHWAREDYQKYKDLVEEGHSRYAAAVQCGMADPQGDYD